MSIDRFDKILTEASQRPELAADWKRQRDTAKEFCKRFDDGSDTQLLGDQVGMGKTYVAMAVIANTVLGRRKNSSKALLITPPSPILRSKWEQELRSFSSSYLAEKKKGSLKPIVIDSFWDLVANLHDYGDTSVQRISEGRYKCIVHSLWGWAIHKDWVSNYQYWWPVLDNFDRESAEAMKFKSDYSSAGWWGFLERKNAEGNDILHRLLKPKGGLWMNPGESANTIKQLFKEFADNQDAYEPNVFILGMNSLNRPRSNSAENQRFATFVLAVLLRGRWETTRIAILQAVLTKTRTLLPDASLKLLDDLANADLYKTRDYVMLALESDESLRGTWSDIARDAASAETKIIRDFFSELLERIVSSKLRDSGIKLAVVDEVHNWKSGANGARHFQKNFAPAIDHKLLISATPFQMDKDEMFSIFEYACKSGGATSAVLNEIYPGTNEIFLGTKLLDACLDCNGQLFDALARLGPQDAALLQSDEVALLPMESIEAGLLQMSRSGELSSRMDEFFLKALTYRRALDALLQQQRLIMIRHVKSRDHRSFHAGKDFTVKHEPRRNALYKVAGLSDSKYALINLLAMRLDQRIRGTESPDTAKPANARLVRGLTSSLAAFKESWETANGQKVDLPPGTQGYMQLFEDAIAVANHPKVSATVEYAYQNFLQGKKTLVFCERVATAVEIEISLRKKIDDSLSNDTLDLASKRQKIIVDHLFSDMQWHRSWSRLNPDRASSAERQDDRRKASVFIQHCLEKSKALTTPRRILRLLDLWFLREEFRQARGCNVVGGTALRLLASLADQLEDSGGSNEAIDAVLNAQTEREAGADETISQSIDVVLNEGFTNGINLWVDEDSGFDRAIWALAESEANRLIQGQASQDPKPETYPTFYGILLGLQIGLKKVVLRPDLLRRCLPAAEGQSDAQAVLQGVKLKRGGGESTWSKVIRFLDGLTQANGTINPVDKTNTQRRSLWRGVELREDPLVARLDGAVDASRRVILCAAFNSPLAPDVLVCTAIGSEGIDLHKECSEIIHHDLPWNPAKLEQRIGRLDRVGRLGEASNDALYVGIPFLAHDYDQFQYEKVLSRAQLFEVLLGKPDFDLSTEEEAHDDTGDKVLEVDCEADETFDRPLTLLPDNFVRWLSVDLSLAAIARP